MKVKTNSPVPVAPADPDSEGLLATAPNERAARVLKAAGEVFLSRGYAGASLETIVAKSGGSLRDLYQVFGNKESLFQRVMADLCEEVLAPLRGLVLDERSRQLPVEEVLLQVGRTFARFLLSPRALSLHRLVVSESPRFPTIGRLFFQMGPSSVRDTVAAFLESRAKAGELSIADPHSASAIFMHSAVSDLHLRAITGSSIAASEVEARVQDAVRIFLAGVKVR
jgi:AcrR family transcriptional regulator